MQDSALSVEESRAPQHGQRKQSNEIIILQVSTARLPKNQVVFQHQTVEAGTLKRLDGVFRTTNDRFLNVKGGIQQRRHAGEPFELTDQPPVPRVGLPAHG